MNAINIKLDKKLKAGNSIFYVLEFANQHFTIKTTNDKITCIEVNSSNPSPKLYIAIQAIVSGRVKLEDLDND